jgi:hypothetical protein
MLRVGIRYLQADECRFPVGILSDAELVGFDHGRLMAPDNIRAAMVVRTDRERGWIIFAELLGLDR